jgi:F-type H+-transporting ATPase subunit epsilon
MSPESPLKMQLRVITPRRLAVEADVPSVSLPGLDGELGILPGHRPLLTALGRGRLHFSSDGEEESLFIRGGYADIRPDAVLVFTELSDDDENGQARA